MKYSLLLSSLLHVALLAGWPTLDSPPRHVGHSAVITLALNSARVSARSAALPTGGTETGSTRKKREPAGGNSHNKAVTQASRHAQWHTHRQNKPTRTASVISSQAKTIAARHTTRQARANTTGRQDQVPVSIAAVTHITRPPTGRKAKNRERPAHPGRGLAVRRLQSSLRHALAPYFHYPLLARRRGWEGIVKLGMHIDATGRLSRVRILHSSGYALLDQAARKSLRQLIVVPRSGKPSDRQELDMVLPIQYRLVNG